MCLYLKVYTGTQPKVIYGLSLFKALPMHARREAKYRYRTKEITKETKAALLLLPCYTPRLQAPISEKLHYIEHHLLPSPSSTISSARPFVPISSTVFHSTPF